MYHYRFDEFIPDIDRFVTRMGSYRPDAIVAIARGGVTLGHFLAEKLNQRNLYTLNSIHYDDTIRLEDIRLHNIPDLSDAESVLVVDDIVDSGDTMQAVIATLQERYPDTTFKTGALFYKEDARFQPDFKVRRAEEWIRFFWNLDAQGER